jgi:hypothetical protein
MERVWQSTVMDMLTSSDPTKERYITLAWIHKRHRNKGANKSNSHNKETQHWLSRLELRSLTPFSPQDMNQNQCFVAFSISEWDPVKKTVFVSQMAPRSVFLKTIDGYMQLLKNLVERIQMDAVVMQKQAPQHILIWARTDHQRLAGIPTRLGLTQFNAYLRDNPALAHSSIREKFPDNDRQQIFAATITDILEK